jgi:hypothetical protein
MVEIPSLHILITIGLVTSLITNWNYADRRSLIVTASVSYGGDESLELRVFHSRDAEISKRPVRSAANRSFARSSPCLEAANLVQRTA